MLRFLGTFCGVAFLLAAVAPAQSPSNATADPARHKSAKSHHRASPDKPSVPSNVPYGPPGPEPERPKTPEELPAVQPRVSYRDGLLTIEAPNSTLGSVLTAIHNKTGIQFEGLQGGLERVVIRTGPAPVDEVLLELLHGSRFDYVMVAREDNPALVQRVVLTLRSGGGAAPANIGQNRPIQQPEVQEEEEGGDPSPLKQEQPVQPPLVQNQQPLGARTPEQMLEDIRRRELQRRQQQLQRQQQVQQQKPDDPPL
jgi:hypothetical protein